MVATKRDDSEATTEESSLLYNKKVLAREKYSLLREEFAKTPAFAPAHLNLYRNLESLMQVLPQKSVVAGYRAKSSECSIDNFWQTHHSEWSWVFPKVSGQGLEFLKPKDSSAFVSGPFQIAEPDPQRSTLLPLKDCSAVLVPALAFDRKGHRIGWGKGFYDRALVGFSGLKIGIAFSVQISNEEFLVNTFDIPMDFVVTENFILKPLQKQKRN